MMKYLILLFSLCACAQGTGNEPKRPVLATVGGAPLYLDEFKAHFARLRVDAGNGLPSGTANDTHKKLMFDEMIERRLILRDAEAKHILVTTDEIDALFQRTKSGWRESDFAEILQKQDRTAAELKKDLRELILIRKYFRQHVFSRVAVTDEEIQDYLEKHPEMLETPQQMRALQILVKTEEEAKKIARELRRGLNFEEAAMKYSISPEGKSGGDLGYFAKGSMPQVIEDACAKLWRNETSRIITSDYGYHIFKLLDKIPAGERPVDEVRNEAEQALRSQKEKEAQDAKLEELRQSTAIEIADDLFEKVQ